MKQYTLTTYPPCVVHNVAFNGTSTAAQQINTESTGVCQVVFQAHGGSCYILFGESNVAAADNSAWPLAAGQPIVLTISKQTAYFRVIQDSASGTLFWYVCGQYR